MLRLVDVGEGLRKRRNLPPLLFSIFFAALLMVAFDDFRKDEEVMADMVNVKRMVTEGKGECQTGGGSAKSIWGMLYAEIARIVSRSSGSLENTMSIIVRVAGRFCLLISAPNPEMMRMLSRGINACPLTTAPGC